MNGTAFTCSNRIFFSQQISYEHEDPSIKRPALKVKCRAARRPAYFFWNIFLITVSNILSSDNSEVHL